MHGTDDRIARAGAQAVEEIRHRPADARADEPGADPRQVGDAR